MKGFKELTYEDLMKNVCDPNKLGFETTEEITGIVGIIGEEYTKIGAKIDKYLNKSTLAGYGEYIAKQSIKKTVNPYLIGAMIIEDSRCNLECTALVDMCNNAAKVKGTPGCFGGSYKKYDKIYNSIDDLINNVYNNYWINNKTMPMQFYKNHGRDISWAYRVEGLITKIKNTK